MATEHFNRFWLFASEPHVLAEGSSLATVSKLTIVGHDDSLSIICVDRDVVILDQPFRSPPALVASF